VTCVRVLAVLGGYPPHQNIGSWLMTHALLRALLQRGHTADVVVTGCHEGEPYELDGVRVWPRDGTRDALRFVRDAHVIVCHVDAGTGPVTIGQMTGVPVVAICHNSRPETARMLARRRPSLLVFNSHATRVALARAYSGPSLVVPPPVHEAEYATAPGDCITLINLSADKGVAVFYHLARRFPDRKFLGVVGGHGEQIIRDDLPNVQIIDHVPAHRMRDDVYARTRVLLMPSAHESYGRAGVEALHSGIPVIAAPTAGLTESLGDAGVFVPPADLVGWERRLGELLDGRRWRAASRKALARAARIDPAADLSRWCAAVEDVARRRPIREGRPPRGRRAVAVHIAADGGTPAR
jgi:glycosyltransferase involved in cell wall biosynthesis